jgi:hypothetical protein
MSRKRSVAKCASTAGIDGLEISQMAVAQPWLRGSMQLHHVALLKALKQTSGSNSEVPFSRNAFEAWSQTSNNSWPDVMRNIQVCRDDMPVTNTLLCRASSYDARPASECTSCACKRPDVAVRSADERAGGRLCWSNGVCQV